MTSVVKRNIIASFVEDNRERMDIINRAAEDSSMPADEIAEARAELLHEYRKYKTYRILTNK